MIGPVALWRGRSCGLLDVLNCPAQPKHHVRPCPLGRCFRSEPLFQAYLERLGIGSLVFGCGWIRKHGGNGSQFPLNSRGKPRLLADRHLRYLPSNPAALDERNLARNRCSRGEVVMVGAQFSIRPLITARLRQRPGARDDPSRKRAFCGGSFGRHRRREAEAGNF
jgi:hypothetical protein